VDALKQVYGIGRQKLDEFGTVLLFTIRQWLDRHPDHAAPAATTVAPPGNRKRQATKFSDAACTRYFELFDQGLSVDDVCLQLDRAQSTVTQYLEQYIRLHRITDIDRWVKPAVREQVRASIARLGNERLKPLFEDLNGQISWDELRLVSAAWDIEQMA
jgi:ATP-dependent DNA helicase RecQ